MLKEIASGAEMKVEAVQQSIRILPARSFAVPLPTDPDPE